VLGNTGFFVRSAYEPAELLAAAAVTARPMRAAVNRQYGDRNHKRTDNAAVSTQSGISDFAGVNDSSLLPVVRARRLTTYSPAINAHG
jgi:hypothetical protein